LLEHTSQVMPRHAARADDNRFDFCHKSLSPSKIYFLLMISLR
jgi:hypothetical protein